MAPIWARYGPFLFYGYTAMLVLGVLLALFVTARLARQRAATSEERADSAPAWLDAAIAAAIGAVIGGRVVFVWLNAAYFAENPAEAWRFWLGGLNYHGALLTGLLALWLWACLTRRSFLHYAALLAPGLALLVAFGWAGCLVEGCAFGRPALPALLAADLPDDTGVYAMRYRTQALGVVFALAVFALSWASARRVPAAHLFWGTLAGLSLAHVFVALGRGDPSPVVFGMRLYLLAEVALLTVAVVALLAASRQATSQSAPQK